MGVFLGGAHLEVLRHLLKLEGEALGEFAKALQETGLAELREYSHLRLHPALCPYLYQKLDDNTRKTLQDQWVAVMQPFVGFLYQQKFQDTQVSATLTLLELPNCLELLHLVQAQGHF